MIVMLPTLLPHRRLAWEYNHRTMLWEVWDSIDGRPSRLAWITYEMFHQAIPLAIAYTIARWWWRWGFECPNPLYEWAKREEEDAAARSPETL